MASTPSEKIQRCWLKPVIIFGIKYAGTEELLRQHLCPLSGNPEYNIHADDIDFQIEADYIGFMCPGMPATATETAFRVGHIMNYGDGVYGGIFVAALYAEAYFETDIHKIVDKALMSLPAESDYYKIIRDVIRLYDNYPEDWRAAWQELENKWGDVDICGAGIPFNIDAKLNGAYIVMGLLYGEGDPMKTLEISTRCGQDSDCNPSNALAVLGVIKGFSGLPEDIQEGVRAIGDSIFIYTSYSFNTAVESTYKYSANLIASNGGRIKGDKIVVRLQEPVAPPLEVSFPDVVFDRKISVFDKGQWEFKGKWQDYEIAADNRKVKQSVFSGKKGDELSISFSGTGLSLEGTGIRMEERPMFMLTAYYTVQSIPIIIFSGQQHTARQMACHRPYWKSYGQACCQR